MNTESFASKFERFSVGGGEERRRAQICGEAIFMIQFIQIRVVVYFERIIQGISAKKQANKFLLIDTLGGKKKKLLVLALLYIYFCSNFYPRRIFKSGRMGEEKKT